MAQPEIGGISPCFIVSDASKSLAFYQDKFGFDITFQNSPEDPFFGIVQRGRALIMLKSVAPEIEPQPNRSRHEWAPWDAYIYVPDPDALAEEFEARGVEFSQPLGNNTDNLRGFEVKDADGYVLYFGRPNAADEDISE